MSLPESADGIGGEGEQKNLEFGPHVAKEASLVSVMESSGLRPLEAIGYVKSGDVSNPNGELRSGSVNGSMGKGIVLEKFVSTVS